MGGACEAAADQCILPAKRRHGRETPSPMRPLMRVSCWLFVPVALGWAQQQRNPFDTAEGLEQGTALFQTHCSYCHGARGEGGRGADLTTGQYRHGGTDANLLATDRKGLPGTEMPAVRATDDEVWKMVSFVKKLGSLTTNEKATGEPVTGKTVYDGK